ncbi:serine/threonine-protein kinase [Allorhodopirellula heiligendammensis]|uniref:Serine/threonine-protein kinase PrkC n=1 Tax=Allorhodopirellula heiligendammensis TaxID=2714739 RepID=A0A5C6BU77_9BACT|nr:serine/threonine-protein kinase [Allorhodopirellula heiligendammensis]TWU15800.1 Serine/threonine-protein kinase PrkC [Allorhodopirellula heiligendammensis]
MPKTASNYEFLDAPTQEGDLGTLGSYRILGELGRGGMGYVFRAIDTVLERPVALKVMNKKVASTPNSRDRFLQEARAMAAVHHDNVVVIFEVGMHEGTPFMAMEMLRGVTLEGINARKETCDYEQVIEYARQIARGLAAAHAKGIVHRDIKPANIWVEEGTGRIKILDFGLALATSPDADAAGVGSVCGTPGYLTPEQARSDPLDDRSDLYSLGVVLYEMCTGRLPTSQPAIPQQLVALLTGTPKPLRELNPAIPQPLADLIHQLLAKEPVDRPANAIALEKQLDVVARECEAKSETAVSLSKLQLSLKEVVSKQEEAKAESFDLSAFEDLALPAASTTTFPGPVTPKPGSLPPAGTKSGVFPAVTPRPGAPRPGAPTPAGKPSSAGVKSKSTGAPEVKPVSPIVWMGAGILGTLLLVLGIVWMILPGQSENTVTVVPQPPQPPPSSNRSSPPSPTPQTKPPGGNASPAGNRNAKNKNNRNSKAPANSRDPVAEPVPPTTSSPESSSPESLSPESLSPESAPRASVAAESTRQVMPEQDRPPLPDPTTTPDPVAVDDPTDEPAQPEPTKVVNVNTTAGIGADSTVREGFETSLATKPILLVQQRKGDGEDKQHVHLRFDLQAKGVSHGDVQQARLGMILSLPGHEKLQNTALQLYGYDAKGADKWVEDDERKAILWENSISREGLASLPLLAQWSSEDPDYANPNVIFFSSPELAAFIRKASGNTVSFVVSGGNPEGTAVRFVSKEGDATKAPTLMLSISAPTN